MQSWTNMILLFKERDRLGNIYQQKKNFRIHLLSVGFFVRVRHYTKTCHCYQMTLKFVYFLYTTTLIGLYILPSRSLPLRDFKQEDALIRTYLSNKHTN